MPCAVASLPNSPVFMPSPRNLPPDFRTTATSPPPPPMAFNFVAEEKVLVPSSKLATNLKRKRPSKIDIPVATLGFEDSKIATSDLEFEGEAYSVYCKKGKRGGAMEDRYAAVLSLEGDSKQAYFGVFDGHGGTEAAEFAAENLGKNVMRELLKRGGGEIEEAVKEGYLTTDAEFLKEDMRGGTCCVTALFHEGNLVVSNVGDCRAVMSRGGVAEALTVDHRPSLDDERERIESLGGYIDCSRGVWRVHGSLAISRAIGDRHLKQWVIAEPATEVIKIKPDCEFLILASDGLWDNVSNQEAVDVVRSLCVGVDRAEPFSSCKKLVDLSLTRGSTDDVSVMVVQLTYFIQ